MNLNLDDALQTFIVESRELLQEMESALLQVDARHSDPELINAIFRAAHTIKGSAGLFGLDHIVAFTHVAETVLDRVRDQELALDDNLSALLLQVCDHLGVLLDYLSRHQQPDEAVQIQLQALATALEGYQGDVSAAVCTAMPNQAAVPKNPKTCVQTGYWHISLRFGSDILRSGMDPIAILRYLKTLGEIVALELVSDRVPPLCELDAESCYLGVELAFDSDVDRELIDAAFDFVRDDCQISLIEPHSPLASYAELLRSQQDISNLSKLLVSCGTLLPEEIERLQSEFFDEGSDSHAVEPLAENAPVVRVMEHAQETQTAGRSDERQGGGSEKGEGKYDAKASVESNLIRVDAGKLDQLINLVGGLIIAGAGAHQVARNHHVPDLIEATTLMTRLVEDVRDSALNLRMVQIGATFNRFRRVVRDVARELGKDIELEIHGGDTELDKTVVEKIGDPLTHIVRNAMDHGIEAESVRVAQGKSATGKLCLNAFHESGSIVIEVSDDGGGLRKERILAKAIERGLIAEGAALSDHEIFNLVFEPGFSTAEQVSKLSGRGVGMDVVKKNILALRGTVELDSQENKGTTVRIRLPLTLAIIDGFLVGVGSSAYVLPLDMVVECIELPATCHATTDQPDYLNLRGGVLPFIRLREHFAVPEPTPARENVVVVQYAGQRAGLVVDRLMGEFQTVIKPLGKVFSQLRGIGGSTILGNGNVALILDIPGLVAQANQPPKQKATGQFSHIAFPA